MPRQPRPLMRAPKLQPGEAARIADYCEQIGLRLVPWQREFLNRLEAASITPTVTPAPTTAETPATKKTTPGTG